jgi:hypothetical protein
MLEFCILDKLRHHLYARQSKEALEVLMCTLDARVATNCARMESKDQLLLAALNSLPITLV